jgi:hypothetical protein
VTSLLSYFETPHLRFLEDVDPESESMLAELLVAEELKPGTDEVELAGPGGENSEERSIELLWQVSWEFASPSISS